MVPLLYQEEGAQRIYNQDRELGTRRCGLLTAAATGSAGRPQLFSHTGPHSSFLGPEQNSKQPQSLHPKLGSVDGMGRDGLPQITEVTAHPVKC